MFRHILIPLDGSRLAETALSAGAQLAGVLGATVTLLHVIERDAPREVHGERHLRDVAEATAYLDEIAARAFPPEVRVERHVHDAEVTDVARGIAGHVGELGPDLIVMCAHGRGGLHGWMFGRIAHQVVNLGTRPVLIVQPGGKEDAPSFTCRRLMVPLDGNPAHEVGLPVAEELAKSCKAGLHLLMVVPTTGALSGEQAAIARRLPGATTLVLDLAEQEGKEYLDRHATRLQAEGVPVTTEVRRGDPVKVIVDVAEEERIDLIVLATHGRTGLKAFWAGTPTPAVTSRSTTPLLLVPAGEEGGAC
jgi:nucleotide-binding universal stress UspA family protein